MFGFPANESYNFLPREILCGSNDGLTHSLLYLERQSRAYGSNNVLCTALFAFMSIRQVPLIRTSDEEHSPTTGLSRDIIYKK